jgi:hypothetical protein
MMIGEDPQASARALAVERIVGDLVKAFCKGAAKIEKKIRDAQSGGAEGAPAPR